MKNFLNRIKQFLCNQIFAAENMLYYKSVKIFLKNKNVALENISQNCKSKKTPNECTIWILITPWLETAVPFFAFEIGESLFQKNKNIGFIFDYSTPFEENHSSKYKKLITKLEKIASKKYPILVRKNSIAKQKIKFNTSFIKTSILENLIRSYKSKKNILDDPSLISNKLITIKNNLSDIVIKLKKAKIKKLVIPGGIYGLSFMYCLAAKKIKASYWTFDSGNNLLTVAKNGTAAHFPQFYAGFKQSKMFIKNLKIRKRIVKSVNFTLQKRINGTDPYRLQPTAKRNKPINSDVLLLLNNRLDSAAMAQNRIFKSTTEWIETTAEICNQLKYKLLIKQHPCEKYKKFRSKESFFYLQKKYPHYVKFINHKMKYNTYSLLKKTKVVVPFSSRSGIEALLFKKPVISHSNAFFDKLPFVSRAENKKHYISLIKSAVNSKLRIKEKNSAVLAYYLLEKCSFINTRITPIPDDFIKWAFQNPINKDENFKKFIECILKNQNLHFEIFKTKIKNLCTLA